MDIRGIVARIVEKKLQKDSDDPCWDDHVQLGTKKKGGKEVPNCVPKESVELDEASKKIEIPKALYNTILKGHGPKKLVRTPKGEMQYRAAEHFAYDKATDTHITQTYSHPDHDIATIEKRTHNPSGKVTHYMYHKAKNEEIELDEVLAKDYSGMLGVFKKDVERAEEAKKKGDSKKMEMHLNNARNRLMGMKSTDTAKLKNSNHYERYKTMKESVELDERVEVDHSRYMRSHSKKARGRGTWMFTTKDMSEPPEDEMVTVSGDLSTAAKEAAKKLGTKRVYVMEEIELDEDDYTALNEAKTDVYHKHMLKALGKSKLPKNHSFTSVIADNGDFIVRDGGGRVVGRIPKAEHDLKESTELTEDVYTALNEAIIDFQRKLMRLNDGLDSAIAREVKNIDEDLDMFRAGSLFNIRSGK